MTAPELKPCPFCGGEASFKPRSFKASCDKCGAYVPCGAQSSDEAISAWNTRATPPEVMELLTALANLLEASDNYANTSPQSPAEALASVDVSICAEVARAALSAWEAANEQT